MTDEISGQVIGPDGTPVQGAIVKIVQQDPPPAETKVARQTTNSNGEYFFDETVVRGTGPWHVTVRYEQNGTLYNDFSKPFIEADLLEQGAESFSVDFVFESSLSDTVGVGVGVNQSQLITDPSLTESAGTATPDSGVARYTFDSEDTNGSAIDVWNGNDASISGATAGVSGANQTYTTNEALSFDGSDDYVDPPSAIDSLIDNDIFSIAFWFYVDSNTSSPHDYGNGRCTLRYEFKGSNGWEWVIYDGSTDYWVTMGLTATGEWHHTVLTLNSSGVMEAYLDGTSKGTDSTASPQDNKPVRIGGKASGVDFWPGDVDDLRYYDKALSDTEVSNLYNNGSI